MLPRHLDRYALAGLLAILLWSSTVAVARSLSEQLGARTAMAAVYLTGAFAFCVRAWCTGQPVIDLRGVGRAYLFGCGGLFVFYTYALFQSVALAGNRMQVLEVGMLNYLWPTLTLLLSLVLLNRRATWLLAPGTALALSGEFLVLSHEGGFSWIGAFSHVQARPAAYGLGLAAGVSWALYSTLTRRWSGPETRGAVPVFVAATGLLMLALRLAAGERSTWTWQAGAEIAFLGSATATAYSAWDLAMRRGNVVLIAAASYFTPLLSTLVSCLYLGVVPGARLWVGCAILIAGSLLSWHSVHTRDNRNDRE